MYFQNFPKIVYDFNLSNETDYRIVTDITRNVRLRKQILENITLYDYYEIQEGDTPEIISEKIYGTPYYHWVIMLVNQRYDYINDFPLTQLELDTYIDEKYGNKKYHVNNYKVNGFVKNGVNLLVLSGVIGGIDVGSVLTSVTNGYQARVDSIDQVSGNTTFSVSLRTGNFIQGESINSGPNTFFTVTSCVIPSPYTTQTNYDYEFALNESKRKIKIVDPSLVEQLVKEFKDII